MNITIKSLCICAMLFAYSTSFSEGNAPVGMSPNKQQIEQCKIRVKGFLSICSNAAATHQRFQQWCRTTTDKAMNNCKKTGCSGDIKGYHDDSNCVPFTSEQP